MKKTKILFLLMAVCLVSVMYACNNEETNEPETEETPFVMEETNVGYELVSYDKTATSVVIPSEWEGKPVVSVASETFANATELKEVTIPSSVTVIDSCAFLNCPNLKKVYYQGTIASWCGMTFGDYDANPLYIAEDFYIDDQLFGGELIIPDSVTEIKDYCFEKRNNITAIRLGKGVTAIGEYAFWDCNKVTSITMPTATKSIAKNVFLECIEIKEVRYHGTTADWCGINFSSYYANPLYYAEKMYCGDQEVTEYVVPASVTTIGDYQFVGNAFTKVSIPSTVTSVGTGVFYNSRSTLEIGWAEIKKVSLTGFLGERINIGKDVTDIEENAFNYCNSLTTISVDTANRVYSSVNGVLLTKDKSAVLFYPEAKEDTIYFVPEGVKTIAAFFNGTIKTLVLPSTIEEGVEDSIYNHFYNLECIDIADGNQYYLCEDGVLLTKDKSRIVLYPQAKMNEVYIVPEGVKTISSRAFAGGCPIETLSLPATLDEISTDALSVMEKLKNINVATGNTNYSSIEGLLLNKEGKTLLCYPQGRTDTTFVIPEGIEVISCDFKNDCPIETLTIPSTMESISVKRAYEMYYGMSVLNGGICDLKHLMNINVAEGNNAYSSVEGVLFDKEKETILFYPNGRTEEEYVIPMGTVTIGAYAFEKNTMLKKITIANSVTDIEGYAFKGCSAEIAWDNNPKIEKISYDSFKGYLGERITIPKSVNSAVCAFSDCSNLMSIKLERAVFLNYDFYSGTKLTTYEYENGVYIDLEGGYRVLLSLVEGDYTSFTVQDGTVILANNCFRNRSIKEIILPDSVVCIGEYVFSSSSIESINYMGDFSTWLDVRMADYSSSPLYNNNGCRLYFAGQELTEDTLVIPEGRERIENYAFYNWDHIRSVSLPASIKSIGIDAFSGCDNIQAVHYEGDLSSWMGISFGSSQTGWNNCDIYFGGELLQNYALVIPEGTEEIGDYCFSGWNCITSVTIPDSVKRIGQYAFNDCYSLGSVIYEGDISDWMAISFGGYASTPFYSSSPSIYMAGEPIASDLVIPDGTVEIGQYAFSGLRNVERIYLPASLKKMGKGAFENVNADVYYAGDLIAWVAIDFEDSSANPTYRNALFLNGEEVSKETVVIPDGCQKIGSYVFYGWKNKTLTLPASVKEIGEDAFLNTKLTRVDYAGSLASWCEIVFGNITANPLYYAHDLYCSGSEVAVTNGELVIPECLETLHDYAFAGCNNIVSVSLPMSMTEINHSAFSSCERLTEICFPAGTKGTYNYNIITSQQESKLRYEGDFVYYVDEDKKLLVDYRGEQRDVIIPSGVTIIRQYAFYGRNNVTSVVIPDSVTTIGDYAFGSLPHLYSVTIGSAVTSMSGAFSNCRHLVDVYNRSEMSIVKDNSQLNYAGTSNYTISTAIDIHQTEEGKKTITTDENGFVIYGDSILIDYVGEESEITLPDTVKRIHGDAFYYNTTLQRVTMPLTVEWIEKYAFRSQNYDSLIVEYEGTISELQYIIKDEPMGTSRIHCSDNSAFFSNWSIIEINDFYTLSPGYVVISINDGILRPIEWADVVHHFPIISFDPGQGITFLDIYPQHKPSLKERGNE